MRSDLTGLEITTDAPAMVDAVDALTAELLRYGKRASAFLQNAAADPECALGQALCGMLHLFTTTREGQSRAAPFLACARATAGRASERERMFVQAVSLWEAGQVRASVAALRALLARWPADLLALKLCQYHELAIDDAPGLLATARHAAAALPGNRHLQAMLAFAIGQGGDHDEAERIGRLACEGGPEPWARHAVAHSLAHAGRVEEGLGWLLAHADEWEDCSSFLYTHNWWHAALFRLELDDPTGALACFDARIWGVRKDYCQDQLNAISLLARLEMHGADAGERWTDIAAYVAPRVEDHLSGFLDLHYIYALARAGRDAEVSAMLISLDRWSAGSAPLGDARLRAMLPVAARGLVAHARGAYGLAAGLLGKTRQDWHRLGASDVQRSLLTRLHRDSLQRDASCKPARSAAG
jgi:hypothetical protein